MHTPNGIDAVAPTRNAIGTMLREMRLRNGFSQMRLARDAGYDCSHVSRVESGDRVPSRTTIIKFAEAMREPSCRLLIAGGYLPEDIVNAIESGRMAISSVHHKLESR